MNFIVVVITMPLTKKESSQLRRIERNISKSTGKTKARHEREFISWHIRHHTEDLGMGRKQAIAAALSEARAKGYSTSLKKLS
jgi:predicted DNA-binding protein